MFSRFLSCTNGTKSRRASHIGKQVPRKLCLKSLQSCEKSFNIAPLNKLYYFSLIQILVFWITVCEHYWKQSSAHVLSMLWDILLLAIILNSFFRILYDSDSSKPMWPKVWNSPRNKLLQWRTFDPIWYYSACLLMLLVCVILYSGDFSCF